MGEAEGHLDAMADRPRQQQVLAMDVFLKGYASLGGDALGCHVNTKEYNNRHVGNYNKQVGKQVLTSC